MDWKKHYLIHDFLTTEVAVHWPNPSSNAEVGGETVPSEETAALAAKDASMASFQEMVDKDIELMYSINEYCNRTPWLKDSMSRIVSLHPWKDITAVVWIAFLIGMMEIGSAHFWVVMVNLIVVMVVRRVVEAKRPFEFDRALQPLTDTNPESFGFPSLESYMSIVVFGHIFTMTRYLLLLPLFVTLSALVGFSRIYSRSRFPHQIVGSWLLGIFGLLLGVVFVERTKLAKLPAFDHGACVAFVLLGAVCHFAISVENNDSRLLGIKKGEFKKVIGDILHGSAEDANAKKDAGDLEPVEMTNPPASQRALRNSMKKVQVKSDSFYYMQKSLEEREARLKGGAGLSATNLRKHASGPIGRRSRLIVDAEDMMFHDSHSESDPTPERLMRGMGV